jgi:tetratricopeptide (TPR) repeat protein
MEVRALSAPFALSIAAVAAVCAVAVWKRRSLPALPAVWFGYLACAAPFFGLTEKGHMASDRYDYFLGVIAAGVLAALLGSLAAHAARMAAAAAGLAFAGFFAVLTDHQLPIWAGDQVQHAYVAAHLTNAELRDDFMSRMEILDFMRGDEKLTEQAVAERLARNPEGQGFWKAATIIVEKKRLSVYYRHASLLAIMHEQMGLRLAERGELREANDHIELALRTDDKFYQAAFDRAIVLLGLGRPDDALNSYLIADRWASPPIPKDRRRGFLNGLLDEASSEANDALAQAARAALAR